MLLTQVVLRDRTDFERHHERARISYWGSGAELQVWGDHNLMLRSCRIADITRWMGLHLSFCDAGWQYWPISQVPQKRQAKSNWPDTIRRKNYSFLSVFLWKCWRHVYSAVIYFWPTPSGASEIWRPAIIRKFVFRMSRVAACWNPSLASHRLSHLEDYVTICEPYISVVRITKARLHFGTCE